MTNLAETTKRKYHLVYKITNIINSKIYIGAHSTDDINDGYLGSGKLIKDAIKKYGKENFKKDILYIFNTPEEMFNMEKEIVTENFIKNKNVYNIVTGGFGGKNKGSTNLKHITNILTGEIIAVDINKIDEFLNNGWKLGGHKPINKGKVYLFKNDNRIAVANDEVDRYVKEGWTRGYKESPTKGKIWIYHKIDKKYTLCDASELGDYLEIGWIQKKWAPVNNRWINKDGVNKRVNDQAIQRFLLDEWKVGKISSSKVSKIQTEQMSKKAICPHCNKEGQYTSMIRWHFDNCKIK